MGGARRAFGVLLLSLTIELTAVAAALHTGASGGAPGWAIVPSPNGGSGGQNLLTSAACASPTECWAAGQFSSGSTFQTMIEEWTGSSWAVVSSPDTSSSSGLPSLGGVVCATATECWAVGSTGNVGIPPLIEGFTGSSWGIVSAPSSSSNDIDTLHAVTCASPTACWGVGDATEIHFGITSTLIEEWTGSSWSIVNSQNRTNQSSLTGVSCASPSECWAVGDSSTSGSEQTLIEKWDGSSWSIVSSPNTSAPYNVLSGVTCTTQAQCWAVGKSGNTGAQTLIEQWDGTTWHIVSSPNPTTQFAALSGVACASAAECWAVGESSTNVSSSAQTLIEEWTGSGWNTVSSPNTSTGDVDQLSAVTCAPSSECWAVGAYSTGGSSQQTLVEEYSSPPPPSGAITGAVTTAAGGSPLAGICVNAYAAGGSTPAASATTVSDGTYTIAGLAPGSYNVRFDSQGVCSSGVAGNYVTQWFNGQPSQASANAVPVSTGSTTPSISAAMVAGAPPASGGVYTAVTPFRVWDTRAATAVQCSRPGGCALGPGNNSNVEVFGNPSGNGSVPSNATAIVLNVTGIAPTTGTYLSVAPAGSPGLGSSSNLNLDAGAIQANAVTVSLPLSGLVAVYNAAGFIDVAMDVQGYFTPSPATPPSSGTAGTFHSIAPVRVCDTRGGSGSPCANGPDDMQLGGGQGRAIKVSTGSTSIPNDGTAAAAAFNLTAVAGSEGTFLTAYPPSSNGSCGTPTTSTLNANAGAILPNRVIVPIGSAGAAAGEVCIYNARGSINFIIDVNGWFGNGTENPAGSLFYPTAPQRICDTRSGTGTPCSGHSIGSGGTLQVSGVGTVSGDPMSPLAIVVNTTGILGSANTFLSLFPDGLAPSPLTSDVNPAAGQIIANLTIVGLNAGKLDVFNAQGTIDVALDAEGWFQ